MANKKYLKEGTAEVVTVLGVYKTENKQLTKALGKAVKIGEAFEKENHELRGELGRILKDAVEADIRAREESAENERSIDLLGVILQRVSNGLSTDKKVNEEGLKPADVKAIVDEALKAFDERHRTENPKDGCAPVFYVHWKHYLNARDSKNNRLFEGKPYFL